MKSCLLSLAFIILFLFGCSKPTENEKTRGTTSETQNVALISGKIFDISGLPAKNALVRFVASSLDLKSLTGAPSYDSTTTDTLGRFGLNALAPGTYNILASSSTDGNKSYKAAVNFTGDSLHIHDTLLPPGSLSGIVQLQPDDDPKSVRVDAIGVLTYSLAKSNGSFSLASMAKGSYFIRIRSSIGDYDDPKYEILDTVLPVVSGKDSILVKPIVLPLKIPIPTGFTLIYDTLKQFATLSWNRMPATKVKSYNIYRQLLNSTDDKMNQLQYIDSFYIDSTAMQDSTYIYRVAPVDSNGKEGLRTQGDTILISSPFKLVNQFGGSGTVPGKFSEIRDIKCLKNGNIIALDGIENSIQVFDSTGQYLMKWPNNAALNMPTSVTEDDSGNVFILEMLGLGRVVKYDVTGQVLQSWIIGQYCTGLYCYSQQLYIADTYGPGIKILDLKTNRIKLINLVGMSPTKIFVNSESNILISNALGNEIILLDTNGSVLSRWGGIGQANGKFYTPGSIISDINKRIYVADKCNGRIQVFNSTGDYLTKLIIAPKNLNSQTVSDEGQPSGITLDKAGNMFVSDKFVIRKYKNNLR